MKHNIKMASFLSLLVILSMLLAPASYAAASAVDDSGAIALSEGNGLASTNPGAAGLPESPTGLYIVRLADPSLARYTGGMTGLAATSPSATGARRLDVNAPASQSYLNYLGGKHADLIVAMEGALGHPVDVRYQYLNVLNAMAVAMTAAEAAQIATLPGVVSVVPDTIQELDTDVSVELIGAPAIWNGNTWMGLSTMGEGVVVGVIDTGVNHDHPSFATTGGDGYTHINPYGSGNYSPGSYCDLIDPLFCNDKLIGAWVFNGTTPEDNDGHGSHTMSTAAGNIHTATITVGTDPYTLTISGVAPHANVIAYKVCNPSCPSSASVAAVNQGIADGVNVFNYSISGSDSPWNDIVDLAFLDAFDAGLYMSASAGNSGPGPSTVAKTGGWNASVGASTTDRVIANGFDVTGPLPVDPSLQGLAAVAGTGPAIVSDIEAGILYSGDVDPGNEEGCSAFPGGSFTGAIALILRGTCTFQTKVDNADAAGAIAVVVFNHSAGPPITMGGLDTTNIPSVFLSKSDGEAVRDWIQLNPGAATARISAGSVYARNSSWEDIMASFSSRGPSQYNVIKPDITAPGVNILAAYMNGTEYAFLQGTSMSSPHHAGSAALMMALNPTWSPAELKSAMVMTAVTNPVPLGAGANILKEDGVTAADWFDMGGGRQDLAASTFSGLVMDETTANFAAADPAIGGDPSTLNLPGLQQNDCAGICTFTRTVKNTIPWAVSWIASVEAPTGVTINVTPSSFLVPGGATQDLTITVDVSAAPKSAWYFAQVYLTRGNGMYPVHMPVAVWHSAAPYIDVTPASLDSTQAPGMIVNKTLTISNSGEASLNWTIFEDGTTLGSEQLADWADNFDSYPTGQDLHGVGGWKGWHNDPAATAFTSSFVANSAPNSVNISGASDLVQEYSAAGGTWTFVAWQYIPGGMEGMSYFIMLNQYDDAGATDNWSVQVNFDSSTGMMTDDGSGNSMPYIADQWVEIRLEIDLNTDTQDFYYNNALLYSGSWTAHQGGSGILAIGAVDLYANGASPVFYDDMSLTMGSPPPVATCDFPSDITWVSASPSGGSTAPNTTSDVTVAFDSTGMSTGVYTGTLCVQSDAANTSMVEVPLTMTVAGQPPPDISVSPTNLDSTQAPDTIVSQTLTIDNIGTSDLVWNIFEDNSTGAGVDANRPGAMSLAPNPGLTLSGADSQPSQRVYEGPLAVLYDQTDNPGTGVVTSQEFEVTNAAFDSQAADDFVVPVVDGSWTIDQVFVDGAYWNGTGPTPLVNVYFYADAGGLPGTELYFYDSIATFTDASGDLTVDLSASPAILTAGTYWVSVQADMDFSAGGQWGWLERTVQSNSESAWRNPSDGFGTGCTSWTSRSGCGVGSEPDLSFQLLGSIGGDPPCSTASDIPWLSASPTSGTTPGGGASAVQVTFDSTGLSAGTYTGSLCVGSNDPDEPVVAVPVTMTVSSSVCPILTPIEPPVIIPPGGGGFSFSLDLINNTGQNQSVDLWLLVTLPTGETVQVKEIFNPTLPPGTTTYQGDQGVPGELSAGTYQYTAHVGSYPTSWCESGFSFVKTGATSMTPRDARQGWELRLRLSSGERPR